MCMCKSCGRPEVDGGFYLHTTDLQKSKKAYLCPHCAEVVFDNDVDFPVVVGKPFAHGVEMQYFIYARYDETVRMLFMRGAARKQGNLRKGEGAWLPCVSGFKSPWFRNRLNHELFTTLKRYTTGNQYRASHAGCRAIKVWFRKYGETEPCYSERIPFGNKDKWLARVAYIEDLVCNDRLNYLLPYEVWEKEVWEG